MAQGIARRCGIVAQQKTHLSVFRPSHFTGRYSSSTTPQAKARLLTSSSPLRHAVGQQPPALALNGRKHPGPNQID